MSPLYGFTVVFGKHSGRLANPVDLLEPAGNLVPTDGHWGRQIIFGGFMPFDVTADGQRFLMAASSNPEPLPALSVFLDWTTVLARRPY